MDKTCYTCKHKDKLTADLPCRDCVHRAGFTLWEPKVCEPQVKPGGEATPSIRPVQQLVILRGVPGAGKTTLAGTIRALSEAAGEVWVTFEKDAWRGYGETRKYQHKYNENAEHWCIGMTADALAKGRSVIVSNTFIKLSYMFPYFQLASELRTRGHQIVTTVCHVQGPVGRSVHGPDVDYQRYIDEWQDYRGEFQDV